MLPTCGQSTSKQTPCNQELGGLFQANNGECAGNQMTELSLCGLTGYTTQTHCQEWSIYISNFTATRLSSKTKYPERSFSMKNGWSTEQQRINPLCATILRLWSLQGWFTLQSRSTFPLHPFCHFAALCRSLIRLLNFPAQSPLFILYHPSVFHSFPYSCPPLTYLLLYKAAPLFCCCAFWLSFYTSVWLKSPIKAEISQPDTVPPLPLSNAT